MTVTSIELREIIKAHFNYGELKTLIADMGFDHENVEGDSKADKVREFVAKMRRHRRMDDLTALVKQRRPQAFIEQPPTATRAYKRGITIATTPLHSVAVENLMAIAQRGSRHKLKDLSVYERLNQLLQKLETLPARDRDINLNQLFVSIMRKVDSALGSNKQAAIEGITLQIQRNYHLDNVANSAPNRPAKGRNDENKPLKNELETIKKLAESLATQWNQLDKSGMTVAYGFLSSDKLESEKTRFTDEDALRISATYYTALEIVSGILGEVIDFMRSVELRAYLDQPHIDTQVFDSEYVSKLANYLSQLKDDIEAARVYLESNIESDSGDSQEASQLLYDLLLD